MYARISYILLLTILVFSSCQEKRKDRFEREAREYTQTHCPQPYGDGVTTLDSMVFTPNDSTVGDLKLYYSLQLTDEQRTAFMDKLGDIGDEKLVSPTSITMLLQATKWWNIISLQRTTNDVVLFLYLRVTLCAYTAFLTFVWVLLVCFLPNFFFFSNFFLIFLAKVLFF